MTSITQYFNSLNIDCHNDEKNIVEYCYNKSQKFNNKYGINKKGEIFILPGINHTRFINNYNQAIYPADINIESDVYKFLSSYIMLNLYTLIKKKKKKLLNINIQSNKIHKYNQIVVNGYLLLNHKITYIEEYSFWHISSQNIKLVNINNQYNIDAVLSYLINNIRYKSLNKILYTIYETEKSYKQFYPNAFYVISRTFKDVNNMITILNNDFLRRESFSKFSLEFYIYIIDFFINLYEEKRIAYLLNTIYNNKNSKFNLWLDSIEILKIIYDIPNYSISDDFKKTKLNIDSIHGECIRVQRKVDEDNVLFQYSEIDLKTQTNYNDLTFKLPIDKHELNEWANQLHNCMAMYSQYIIQQQTLIYGVFIDGIIKYAVRITNKKIIEMKGKYNEPISSFYSTEIKNWLSKY